MNVWIDTARAATAVSMVLLALLGSVWARNYMRLRSKHTLGMLVFATLLFFENASGLYYYLIDPDLSVWFSTAGPGHRVARDAPLPRVGGLGNRLPRVGNAGLSGSDGAGQAKRLGEGVRGRGTGQRDESFLRDTARPAEVCYRTSITDFGLLLDFYDMPIPNYGDKYDSPALFSPSDAINGQGGDSEAEIPRAIIITYQRDFFEWILTERSGRPDTARQGFRGPPHRRDGRCRRRVQYRCASDGHRRREPHRGGG